MLSIFGRPLIITSGGYDKAAGKNVGVSSKALYQVSSKLMSFINLNKVSLCKSFNVVFTKEPK